LRNQAKANIKKYIDERVPEEYENVSLDLLQLQNKQRRYYQCNKGCGQEIYFDASNKSQSGKFIPLNKESGPPHHCQ
jgi:hypothetical protein